VELVGRVEAAERRRCCEEEYDKAPNVPVKLQSLTLLKMD